MLRRPHPTARYARPPPLQGSLRAPPILSLLALSQYPAIPASSAARRRPRNRPCREGGTTTPDPPRLKNLHHPHPPIPNQRVAERIFIF
ncbi:MAG: hypothetical protein BJ554DRAFT_6267 [Olpidium bornovanus]|uniref:Uncharacterized protein n=1 Tax=Olpidium bornovanus TaxID=278681 RepID=A0A8H7ZYG1_9FUNG|nr:MAG: hypothetical protein BJ554DRAFT_6267 [Olpidium bornovanus]